MRGSDAVEPHATDERQDALMQKLCVTASAVRPRTVVGLEVREPTLGELAERNLGRDGVVTQPVQAAAWETAMRAESWLNRRLAPSRFPMWLGTGLVE